MCCLNKLLWFILMICFVPVRYMFRQLIYVARLKYTYFICVVFVWLTAFLALIESQLHQFNFRIFFPAFLVSFFFLIVVITEWFRRMKRKHMSVSHPSDPVQLRRYHAFENPDPERGVPLVPVVQLGNVISLQPSQILMPEVDQPERLTPSEVTKQIFKRQSPTTPVRTRKRSFESNKRSKNSPLEHRRHHSEPFQMKRQTSDVGTIPTHDHAQPGTSASVDIVVITDMDRRSKALLKRLSTRPTKAPKSTSKHRRHYSEPYTFFKQQIKSDQESQEEIVFGDTKSGTVRSKDCLITAEIHVDAVQCGKNSELENIYDTAASVTNAPSSEYTLTVLRDELATQTVPLSKKHSLRKVEHHAVAINIQSPESTESQVVITKQPEKQGDSPISSMWKRIQEAGTASASVPLQEFDITNTMIESETSEQSENEMSEYSSTDAPNISPKPKDYHKASTVRRLKKKKSKIFKELSETEV